METVVEDHTPLADYLIGKRLGAHSGAIPVHTPRTAQLTVPQGEGEGEGESSDWNTPDPDVDPDLSSPPSSPGFAPKGRPTVRSRFREKAPPPLTVYTPQRTPLSRFKSKYSVSLVAAAVRLPPVSNSYRA